MKIADERMFRQYDELVGSHWAQRSQQAANKPVKEVKMPGASLLRWSLVFGVAGFALHRYHSSIEAYLKQYDFIDHRSRMLMDVWRMYARCRWEQMKGNSKHGLNKEMANSCYLTKLESEHVYLTQQNPEKRLFLDVQSDFVLWIWAWGNRQKLHFVNKYGDLVERNRTSKMMLGSWIRIWGSQEQKVLRRETVFEWYQKNQGKVEIRKECEMVNRLNKMRCKTQEYEALVEECIGKGTVIQKKIDAFVAKRLKEEARKGIKPPQ